MLVVLDTLGLSSYKQTFQEQCITGEVLAECTDEVLHSELDITSKLHRIKLLGVIKGSAHTWALVNSKRSDVAPMNNT